MTVFDLPAVERLVRAALEEDIGRGDLTTQLTVPAGTRAEAELLAKQDLVLAGLPLLERVFDLLGATVKIAHRVAEGSLVGRGTVVSVLEGAAADLLTGERVALNFVQHLSGVATLTRRFVDAVAGTRARIVDTRKTLPGLRVLEKYAVRTGGGANHRMGLDDGVLIKDNHIVAAGGITAAVTRARETLPHTVKIEVECTTLAQVDEALGVAAEAILLDNMTPERMKEAVARIGGRAVVEASGGVNLDTVRAIAETGVDLISVGALTHSAPAVDLSLEVRLAA